VTDSVFSPAQLEAITAGDGPLAIVAGPGCGKTTTLAGRVAHLINTRGVDPAAILVLSFTTEAARRLRREVQHQLGKRAADVSVLTLHALGRHVIDTWSSQLGYAERPTVLHQDEARALLASAADAMGWDVQNVSISDLADGVERCRLLADQEARLNHPLRTLASVYEDRLRRHCAIDFVAMLSLPLQLFERHEPALRVLQDAYACVIADEVQDLDGSEWRLVELLAERHANLVVAGDQHQCLFGWRGADPFALQHFVERHPSAGVVSLAQNHRATRRLVDVGNAIGELLEGWQPLWTDNADGPPPRMVLAEDEHAEAAYVAAQIGALLDRGLLPHPGEAAVLFRTRAQADVLAGALRELALPYRLHGTPDLFGIKIVRDAMAYLRLALDPRDRPALARIVDVPPRGLRSMAPTLLEEPATLAELPARAAEFGAGAVSSAAGLMSVVFDLHDQASRGLSPASLLDRALDRTGLRMWLEQHPDGLRRLRPLARLREVLQHVDTTLQEWLDLAALGEDLGQADEQSIRLTSLHAAKGHQWRTTFVVGVEDGLMPHYRAVAAAENDGDTRQLEEELRAMYVALTRARERLYVSACVRRTRGERLEPRKRSRWLQAIPPDLLVVA
jgi:DNA helicase-2/ATP-dependent DNA helicase PcrA